MLLDKESVAENKKPHVAIYVVMWFIVSEKECSLKKTGLFWLYVIQVGLLIGENFSFYGPMVMHSFSNSKYSIFHQ